MRRASVAVRSDFGSSDSSFDEEDLGGANAAVAADAAEQDMTDYLLYDPFSLYTRQRQASSLVAGCGVCDASAIVGVCAACVCVRRAPREWVLGLDASPHAATNGGRGCFLQFFLKN